MSDIKYNVSKLFKTAFGINSPIYVTGTLKQNNPANISYKGLETLPDYLLSDWGETPLTSWMGTPIVFATKFMNNQGMRKYKPDGSTEQVQMADFILPPATMFSFRRAKNIIKTSVLGSNGTVKEVYGFDDWIIDARGICLDEPNRSAKSQLEELLSYNELASSIGVSGSLFIAANIKAVCITDFSYDVIQASNGGAISFQMQLTSDEDIIMFLGQ